MRKAAEVNNSEPAKNVTASQRVPAAFTYAGTAPSANSSEPVANSTASHQPRAAGAHLVEPASPATGDSPPHPGRPGPIARRG